MGGRGRGRAVVAVLGCGRHAAQPHRTSSMGLGWPCHTTVLVVAVLHLLLSHPALPHPFPRPSLACPATAPAGVLIDDLTTLGAKEPYRMFTSRAEYRLSLRAENADARLTRRGFTSGFVSQARMDHFAGRERERAGALAALSAFALLPSRWEEIMRPIVERDARKSAPKKELNADADSAGGGASTGAGGAAAAAPPPPPPPGFSLAADGRLRSAADILAMPGMTSSQVIAGVAAAGGPAIALPPRVTDAVETAVKYAGYLERQAREIEAFRRGDALPLPPDITYEGMPALSKEEQELLAAARPATVHAAGRIAGVRPSTLMLLFQAAKRYAAAREAEAKTAATAAAAGMGTGMGSRKAGAAAASGAGAVATAAEVGDAVGTVGIDAVVAAAAARPRTGAAGGSDSGLPLPADSFADGVLPADVALGAGHPALARSQAAKQEDADRMFNLAMTQADLLRRSSK